MITHSNVYREQEERKLMRVLEYFLSLHEADDVYNALFDDNVSEDEIEGILKTYHIENSDVF